MMLLLDNNTFCWISNIIYSTYYLKNCLMAPLKSALTKKLALNSNMVLSLHIIVVVLFHTYTAKPSYIVELGILEPCTASEWASPAFIIPKKDGSVQQITD